jgi:death-on-curing protein
MTYFLTLSQILLIHQRLIQQSGGTPGLRDFAALESAVAQPKMTFDKNELYPTLSDKAAALGYSLIKNHPFIDGNKRICHAAIDVLLVLNGFEIDASVADQEKIIIQLAAGKMERDELVHWLKDHMVRFKSA